MMARCGLTGDSEPGYLGDAEMESRQRWRELRAGDELVFINA